MVSSAYRRLSDDEARWFDIHAQARNDLLQSLVGLVRAQAQHHVADGVLQVLDPRGADFLEWKAQMLRQQAAALDLRIASMRLAAFATRQSRRLTRKLLDG